MSISVAGWNIQEGLGLPSEMPRVIEAVKRLETDVVVLSDAHSLDNATRSASQATLEEGQSELRAMGYDFQEVEYDDLEPWQHSRFIMMLNRGNTTPIGVTRLDTRNALEAKTSDGISIVGAHFDDRNEETRLLQAKAFIDKMKSESASVLIGDLNALHRGRDLASSLIKLAMNVIPTKLLPNRLETLGSRVVEMAQGDTLSLLESKGYRDTDGWRRPTFSFPFMPSQPLLQLDHCMISPGVELKSFDILPRSLASDHRAIRAVLEV